jgi:thiopurine S-methyltransferase
MEADFWHTRWQDNRIAFHQGRANHYLVKYFHALNVPPGGRVFVPLCGKSVDMRWLGEQGCTVTGVELSDIAVRDFFHEQGIEATHRHDGAFQIREGAGIRLLAGDFFQLNSEHLAAASAVYDRAALVALPDEMRSRYVDHLLAILPPTAPMLLLTFEYSSHEMEGPPFSVDEAQVRALFGERRRVTRLESLERLQEEQGLAERGLTHLEEHAFLLSVI